MQVSRQIKAHFFLWGVLGGIVFASPEPVFAREIEVKVSERGTNATEARMKAMSRADRLALEKVLIEKYPEKAQKILRSFDDEALNQMVESYQILEEAMTPETYRATIKVTLNDSALSKITLAAPAKKQAEETEDSAATTTATPPKAAPLQWPESEATLVLPVWMDEKGVLLWESANKWRKEINKTAVLSSQTQWIVPFGDPTDMLMLDGSQIQTITPSQLIPLAARYGAGAVLLAIAKPAQGTLTVDMHRIAASGEERHQVVLDTTPERNTQEKLLHHAAEILLLGSEQRVAEALTEKQRLRRQQEDPKVPAPLHEINAILHLRQAKDWAELRYRLQKIEGMEALQVVAANWQQMQVKLAYRGDPENLGESLAKAGITVQHQHEMLILALR
jgi:hypothetical protein